jgi:hypothetical protein
MTHLDKLSKALNIPLYPYLLLLSPTNPYGFTRDWIWLANPTEANQHKASARQWFALAFITLVIFIFLNIHRDEKFS